MTRRNPDRHWRTAAAVVVLVMAAGLTVAAPARALPASSTPRNYGFFPGTLTGGHVGNTDIGIDCDDCTKQITLPFPVNVYGTTYTTAVVSSNGNVQFTTNELTYANTCLPNASMGVMVAPYWDDLTTADVPAHGVFTQFDTTRSPPDFTIEWKARSVATGNDIDFGLVFEQSPGGTSYHKPHMVFFYADPTPPSAAGATIGVQRPDRGLYRQLACNSPERLGEDYGLLLASPVADFDGNGSTDAGVFRPSNGAWYIRYDPTLVQTVIWGTNGDKPAPADYDKDGDTDIAVFRPSTGTWFVKDGPTTQFGTNGDIPLPGPYRIDVSSNIVLYRPSTGTWFTSGGVVRQWGTSGDVPVPADYDGDGLLDVAVFRPSSGTWFVKDGPTVAFGTNGDIPVPGDYNGDGIADIAVFRPSNGYWFIRNGPTIQFGTNGDIPVPGHYGGDPWKIAVFRPSNGYWFIKDGSIHQFGTNGDIPLSKPLGSS